MSLPILMGLRGNLITQGYAAPDPTLIEQGGGVVTMGLSMRGCLILQGYGSQPATVRFYPQPSPSRALWGRLGPDPSRALWAPYL